MSLDRVPQVWIIMTMVAHSCCSVPQSSFALLWSAGDASCGVLLLKLYRSFPRVFSFSLLNFSSKPRLILKNYLLFYLHSFKVIDHFLQQALEFFAEHFMRIIIFTFEYLRVIGFGWSYFSCFFRLCFCVYLWDTRVLAISLLVRAQSLGGNSWGETPR